MITPSKTLRRPLKFKTVEELNSELDRLQNGRCEKLGNWSLAQACRHLAMTIEGNLTPPESYEPTAEELAMKQKFFGMVMGPDGMPEQLPIGNPALIPGEDCTDTEVDHLKLALQQLIAYPHAAIKVGRCGPVPTQEVTALHLAHAAHHLGFLVPVQDRRALRFKDADEAIAEIHLLRKGCTQLGNWTLPQVCRHLTIAINNTARPAVDGATPEQTAMRPTLEKVLATGKIPAGLQSPEKAIPPTDCNEADIDALIAALAKVKAYAEPSAAHPRFGPLTLDEFQQITLAHAAHHLSHLISTGE